MLLEWDDRRQSPAIFPRKILSTTPTPCCPFSARDNRLFSHRQRYALQQQNQTKSEKMRWRCFSRRRGVILHTWSNVEAFFFYFFFFRSRLPGTCISHANTHTHTESRNALTTAATMLTMERSSWICFEFSMQMQHNIWHSEMRSGRARDHRLTLSHNTADWCSFFIDSLQPITLVFSIRNLCCLDPTEIKRVCAFGISSRVFFCVDSQI